MIASPETSLNQNIHLNIHTLSGIRTHDPSIRASDESACLR
jgi:hypothetical protein